MLISRLLANSESIPKFQVSVGLCKMSKRWLGGEYDVCVLVAGVLIAFGLALLMYVPLTPWILSAGV